MTPTDDFADLVGAGEAAKPAKRAAKAAPQPEEPKPAAAGLVPDDTVLAAHLARQKNWEKDAAHIFRGPTEDERRRNELLADLAKIDERNNAERVALGKAAAKAQAEEQAAAIRSQIEATKASLEELEAEAKRLEDLAKG